MSTTFRTLTGKHVDLTNPKRDDIDVEDLLVPLVRTPRYNSALWRSWTVGQHILAMYAAASERGEPKGVRQAILLHDLHEAYTGDIPRPVKALLQPQIKYLEERLDKAIHSYFGHIATPAELARCKQYDDAMIHAEYYVFCDIEYNHACEFKNDLVGAIDAFDEIDPGDVNKTLIGLLAAEFTDLGVMQ